MNRKVINVQSIRATASRRPLMAERLSRAVQTLCLRNSLSLHLTCTLAHARLAHSLLGQGCTATLMSRKFSGRSGPWNGMISHSSPSFQEQDWPPHCRKERWLPQAAPRNLECVLCKGSGTLQWHKDARSSGFPDQGLSAMRGFETSHRHFVIGHWLGAREQPKCPWTDKWIKKVYKLIHWTMTQPWRRRNSCPWQPHGWTWRTQAQRSEPDTEAQILYDPTVRRTENSPTPRSRKQDGGCRVGGEGSGRETSEGTAFHLHKVSRSRRPPGAYSWWCWGVNENLQRGWITR